MTTSGETCCARNVAQFGVISATMCVFNIKLWFDATLTVAVNHSPSLREGSRNLSKLFIELDLRYYFTKIRKSTCDVFVYVIALTRFMALCGERNGRYSVRYR